MRPTIALCFSLILCVVSGCAGLATHHAPEFPASEFMPRELDKVSLPKYVIEPPDLLIVEALHIVPKPPYQLRTADIVAIMVQGTLPDAPIGGNYVVEPGGIVDLGPAYGKVHVADMSVEAARAAIDEHLRQSLRSPVTSLQLVQMSGMQQIAGEHLVGMDGSINLGSYGSVSVVGLTLEQAKEAVEAHLSKFLEAPEVTIDVFAYNSKVYYIITEGAGLGDGVVRLPVTGNETVLDALSNVNGLTEISSKRIWIARPSPYDGDVQILPVDWRAITRLGSPETNYQVLPGDRVFIAQDQLVTMDTYFGKILAPVERVMGFATLGVGTAARFSGKPLRGGGLRGAFGTTPSN